MADEIETFHPAEFIIEELEKRGWTTARLAFAAGGDDLDRSALDLYLSVQEPGVLLGDLAGVLAKGFGTSEELWLNLDAAWRLAPDRSRRVDPPSAMIGISLTFGSTFPDEPTPSTYGPESSGAL